MSNMNGKTRKKLYEYIAKRDGESCKNCGKLPSKGQLVIDHTDNNTSNNDPSNLQLLCRRCNYLKNPRRRPFDLCVNTEKSDSSLTINQKKEPRFREWVYSELNKHGGKEKPVGISTYYIVNSGAELVGVSPVTTKRYLNKMCSKHGELMYVECFGDNENQVAYKSFGEIMNSIALLV